MDDYERRAWWWMHMAAAAGGGSPAPSYDPAAVALFAAMETQPDATRKTLYNNLIVGLQGDGVWSLIDFLHVYAAHDGQAARLNIRNPAAFAASEGNSPTFTTDRGYSNAGTAFVDTNYNPATAGGGFVQNSAHAMTFNTASTGTTQTQFTMGRVGSSIGLFVRPRQASDLFDGQLNNTGTIGFGTAANRVGSRIISRIAADDMRGYVGGLQNGATSNTTPSAISNSGNVTVLRSQAVYNTVDTVGAVSIGAGLDATQAAALHTRVATFLTAVGAL